MNSEVIWRRGYVMKLSEEVGKARMMEEGVGT